MKIPFNKVFLTGKEIEYISQAHTLGQLAGDGEFTKRCSSWLENVTGAAKALLTHSCTGALEMAALLANIKPGDEIIMPSYTFVSTANAFVLRGGVPVFIDIRSDTLNLNEKLIEAAITPKTRAIVPVHYAGVACEMDTIMAIADSHGLRVIEDAAQAVLSSYRGRVLGSIGDLGTYSFHETKNVVSGEGGALLVNDPSLTLRAEIIREKGTDRSSFFRGEIDKYTWRDMGSSFLPGELIAAFLWAQLEEAQNLTTQRMACWQYYHKSLETLESDGLLRRPIIPKGCIHNAHMYYILLEKPADREGLLDTFRKHGISSVFHYIPLHSSPAGKRFGRSHGELPVTTRQSNRLVRLPLWAGLLAAEQEKVVSILGQFLRGHTSNIP